MLIYPSYRINQMPRRAMILLSCLTVSFGARSLGNSNKVDTADCRESITHDTNSPRSIIAAVRKFAAIPLRIPSFFEVLPDLSRKRFALPLLRRGAPRQKLGGIMRVLPKRRTTASSGILACDSSSSVPCDDFTKHLARSVNDCRRSRHATKSPHAGPSIALDAVAFRDRFVIGQRTAQGLAVGVSQRADIRSQPSPARDRRQFVSQ